MTRLLATLFLLLMTLEASPARAAEAIEVDKPYEVLGIPLTEKRIAIGAALVAGLGVAAVATIAAESLGIGAGAGFLVTFALFEFLTLPVEAGVGTYLWPDPEGDEAPQSPIPAGKGLGELVETPTTP